MIEYREKPGGGSHVVLTACPCGYEFTEGCGVVLAADGTRFGNDRCRHYYEDHVPGDFLP